MYLLLSLILKGEKCACDLVVVSSLSLSLLVLHLSISRSGRQKAENGSDSAPGQIVVTLPSQTTSRSSSVVCCEMGGGGDMVCVNAALLSANVQK